MLSRAFAIILSEDSPFHYKFTWILLKMAEGGITKLLYEKDDLYYLQNLDNTDNFEASRIKDVSITFLILIMAWIFGTAVLLIEFVLHKILKPNTKSLRAIKFREN